jgi:hypothetical protein
MCYHTTKSDIQFGFVTLLWFLGLSYMAVQLGFGIDYNETFMIVEAATQIPFLLLIVLLAACAGACSENAAYGFQALYTVNMLWQFIWIPYTMNNYYNDSHTSDIFLWINVGYVVGLFAGLICMLTEPFRH